MIAGWIHGQVFQCLPSGPLGRATWSVRIFVRRQLDDIAYAGNGAASADIGRDLQDFGVWLWSGRIIHPNSARLETVGLVPAGPLYFQPNPTVPRFAGCPVTCA